MSLTHRLPTPRIEISPLGALFAAPFTTLIPNLKGCACRSRNRARAARRRAAHLLTFRGSRILGLAARSAP